jgi:hypothetical protein
MTTASLNELKKEIVTLDVVRIQELCLRLAKYKKENKELLSYLLFEAYDESKYIDGVKLEMDDLFRQLPEGNSYYIKKSLRKILRVVNRHIKYSGIKSTEIELRVYFCKGIKTARVRLDEGTVLYNLYQQQLKKINTVVSALPDDLQFDYHSDLEQISN